MALIIITPAEIVGGTISYIIIHGIVFILKKLWEYGEHKTERVLAIRHHYHRRALKKGHSATSVLDCSEGKCSLL